ncbi:hypothetical protein KI688_006481 [Linnemannia hyalina]|uniref:G domain-containing protein n=1 Tax=Linnemannia hyalina TaxID=64524 RepID=A0A9P7XKB0_9FUNG|nr:hypothetical protein KI688_006481 [Linnemannia hyalina]
MESGKSTLIEGMKKYANPNYSVCKLLTGNANLSHTDCTTNWTIVTELPRCKVVQTKWPPKEVPSDVAQLMAVGDMKEYEDELDERNWIEMVRPEIMYPSSGTTFRIIDTPGFNDTEGRDELHLSRIYDAVVAAGSIDLVLTVISNEPLTQELQEALKTYANMFPELRPAFAFVHTKVKYQDLHLDNQTSRNNMRERQKLVESLMGRSNLRHFLIDCDLDTTRPIRMCLTNNIIRDILNLSISNESVFIATRDINETPRMREFDHRFKKNFKLRGERRFTHSGNIAVSVLEISHIVPIIVAVVVAVAVVVVTIRPPP